MPGCAVDPHSHHHRRHPIDPADSIDHGPSTLYGSDGKAVQPFSLAYLLAFSDDAESDGDDSPKWDALSDVYSRADDATQLAFARILFALEGDLDPAALSPSERAEFDRRTT